MTYLICFQKNETHHRQYAPAEETFRVFDEEEKYTEKQAVPKEIQDEVQRRIDEFNHSHLKESTSLLSAFFGKKIKRGYSAHYKGRFLYLDRTDRCEPLSICRLMWKGSMDDWDFAIYRSSSEKYDPEEWFFPGQQYVDGPVTGVMKVRMVAYEIR